MMHPPQMDLDDKVVHYLLIGIGLGLGSFVKAFYDKLAEKFWDKEWQEFRKFKEALKAKKD
jgi:hypothetical protein